MWKRVFGPTVLVILCWASVNIATTFFIHWQYRSQERILSENVTSIRAAGKMLELLWRMQALASEVNTDAPEFGRKELEVLKKRFEEAFVVAEGAVPLPQVPAVIKQIRDQFADYCELLYSGMMSQIETNRISFSIAKTKKLATEIDALCEKLMELNERAIDNSTASHSRFLTTVSTIRIIAIIVGPALGVLLGVAVSRNLNQSISQIRITLQDAPGEAYRQLGQIEVSSSSELSDIHQKVQGLVSRMRDTVQELHQVRSDFVKSERLAAVGELAAGVAHELRNPLTSIKLLVQTAIHRGSGESLGQRPLQVVVDEIARMETTIQGLLDFARPPSLQRTRHDLRETVQRSIDLISGRSQQHNVNVVTDFPKQPVLLDADPNQLQQVFVNLLINGIESMKGGGTLGVAIDDSDRDLGVCRIRFTDSGCGIPEPVLNRMFEPFVTSKERGTGLGLAVSRTIVLEHRGSLFATNRETGGAIFTVELPNCAAQESDPTLDACSVKMRSA